MEVVINQCYGGFGLSPEAVYWLKERGWRGIEAHKIEDYYGDRLEADDSIIGHKANLQKWREHLAVPKERELFLVVYSPDEKEVWNYSRNDAFRADPELIECVKTMGEKADGRYANLAIIEIPDGVDWHIDEYDGFESIHENHRSWG